MTHTLTSPARKGSAVHVISNDPAVGMASFTACGRRIGDDWRGEYSEAPAGPVTCKRCAASLPPAVVCTCDEGMHAAGVADWCLRNADGSPRPGLVTGPPAEALAVYGAHITYPDPDRDTFTVWGDDGTLLGTVDSTRDHTGDVHATRASGETVAPRFTDHGDAVAYLLGGERSELCARSGVDTTGGCIRAAGHRLHCQDSRGDRWDPAVRWDHGSVRIFPSYGLASDTGTSSDGIGWSRWSLVNGMYVRPDSAEDRAARGVCVDCADTHIWDDGGPCPCVVAPLADDEPCCDCAAYPTRHGLHCSNCSASQDRCVCDGAAATRRAAWDAWKARGQAVGRARLALSLAQSYRVNGAPLRARVHLSTAAAARGQAASASRTLSALGGVTR